jgi:dihydropyrimidine dehydrogenase (NAD+) subunit PreT
MIYRRGEREMPAYDYEYELAKQDAVEFLWQTAPVEVIASADGAGVAALRCVRTELSAPDASGRRVPLLVPGSEFDVPVEIVVKATGQEKRRTFLERVPGLRLDAAGRVIVNPETMQSENPKYFAGGDAVNGGREAVDAAQHGKLAAQGIHRLLTGEEVRFAGA